MAPSEQSKPVIGLLGGIGSGKSTIARKFAKLGCGVIDADALGRDVLKFPRVIAQLSNWWGPEVVGADGQLDRSAIARIVFKDRTQLSRLESFIHPLINQMRLHLYEQFGSDANIAAIVEDSPLLLEKGLDYRCDVLVFVKAPLEARLMRVKKNRGWSEEELRKREKQQIALDIKQKRADYVIDNDGDEAECLSRVRHVLSQILQERA